MTVIKPFKAIYYHQEKAGDLSEVFCPPYDVISHEEQAEYHNKSPFNFIHILLGRDKSTDERNDNKYTRAKKIFWEWIKKGILVEDDKPCLYYYKQEYKIRGEKHSRLGFISLMKLQDEEDSTVFPHENTHSQAIEDRLRLLRNVKANLSSIFVCFSDKTKKIEKIFLQKMLPQPPVIHVFDNEGVRHLVWRLSDPALIEEITQALADQHIFIADGHHRYEVALRYRRFKLRKKSRSSGREPFNYVMTYFTNMDSKDLMILPMHRIIKKLPHKLDFLEDYFRMDRVSSKEDLLIYLAKAGQNEHAFGLYTPGGIRLLRLKNVLMIDQLIREGSKEYRRLDATILQHFVFNRAGVQPEHIQYTKDMELAIQMVDRKEAVASFIMNPVKIHQLKSIALNGERMPPKTTYFYPKLLSGLTVYRLEND
jgi:uncharacterized protein (DUF1015 family)